MAWAAGTFSRAGGATKWAIDRDASTEIEAGIHDTHDEDLATGINSCINKDGSNAMTANLNLGTNKITNVVDGTADQDAATVKYVADNFGKGLATNDELLIRLATHTTIPTGWTISAANDNYAVKITGNAAAAADAGTNNFDGVFVNAVSSIVANESSHTHTFSDTSSTPSASELVQTGSSAAVPDSNHTHTVSGTTGSGSNHKHTITMAAKRREFHIIIKD